MAYWQEHTLLIAPQISGFGTVNSSTPDFVAIQGDRPKVTKQTEKVELDLMSGQVGAAPERLAGRRHGTISFSMPLEGMKSAYDPTIENPGDTGVLPPWACLVANALGSYIGNVDSVTKFWKGLHLSVSEYTSGGVASATAGAITLDDAAASDKVLGGELVVTAASATSATPQFGFVKTKAGQVLTLFENSGNTVNSGTANVYGTATAYMSAAHSNQIPLTMRHVGNATEACTVLADCVCTGFKITWNSGEVPTIEFNYNFYDFSEDKTLGGLVVPSAYQRIPQIVGASNGRATLAGSLKCGMESCTIEYKTEVAEFKCHSATQGIAAVSYRKPRVTVNVSLPWVSTDLVYDAAGSAGNTGSHVWQSYFERNVTQSLACYVGSKVGRLFAFLIPAGTLVDAPQVADLNGNVGFSLTMEAGAYSGDASDTAESATNSPKNSLFRLALG